MLTLLLQYLRIDTSQPEPDYDSAITLFLQQAKTDGLEASGISLPSGKKVIAIVARGTDPSLQALAFNQHMDVVPSDDPLLWDYAPFSGIVDNGIIYGRGVQDMKGVGVAHYAALRRFVKTHKIFRRTILLLLVPDEEIGGFTGAGQLIDTLEFAALNIGYVIDEGCSSGDPSTIFIKTSERRPLQIIVSSTGTSAHGSLLNAHNCIHDLIAFLNTIQILQQQQKDRAQHQDPGEYLSMHITSLASGTGCLDGKTFNTIPAIAHAGIDIRIPPENTSQYVIDFLDHHITQFTSLSYEIKALVPDEMAIKPSYELITVTRDACKTYGLSIKEHRAETCSDLRFYSKAGIQGIGLTPFTTPPNPHGINESLPVDDFMIGIDIFFNIIKAICL
jgi:N-acyl-L-amino-acid amidohydrolase